MYENDGLYLFLEREQMQRTVVKGKQRTLPVRFIAEEIMGFSELDFRSYAEGLDRVSILSRGAEACGGEWYRRRRYGKVLRIGADSR